MFFTFLNCLTTYCVVFPSIDLKELKSWYFFKELYIRGQQKNTNSKKL